MELFQEGFVTGSLNRTPLNPRETHQRAKYLGKIRRYVVLLLSLLMAGCFDKPFEEHLHLWFTAEGPIVVTVVQKIGSASSVGGNAALGARLEQIRSEMDQGIDRWSNHFRTADSLAEHLSFYRVGGETRTKVHSVAVASFDDVERILEAEGMSAGVSRDQYSAELVIVPSGGTRATAAQQDHLNALLDVWAVRIAEYLKTASRLYKHLEENPDRAVPCLAHLFDRHEGLGETGPLGPDEQQMIVAVKRAMERVQGALRVPSTESYSLNELTRRVYDPFPARLSVAVEGDVSDVEGYLWSGESNLERVTTDAWSALRSLEGRWLSPDLVSAVASVGPYEAKEDPASFSIRLRFYLPSPTPEEVRSAMDSALIPPSSHRIRWQVSKSPARGGAEDSESDWQAVIATAEAQVHSQ